MASMLILTSFIRETVSGPTIPTHCRSSSGEKGINHTHSVRREPFFSQALPGETVIAVLQQLSWTKLWTIFHCFDTKCIQWQHLSKFIHSFLTHTQTPAKLYVSTALFAHVNILFSKLLNLSSKHSKMI